MDFSKEYGLRPDVVEKDYVLGWILDGISNHAKISSDWIFKGGTCLKKCYFETYRFSEDLDFTLKKPEHLNNDFLMDVFKEVAGKVYEKSGIEIPKDKIDFEIYANPRGRSSVQGKISYRGPMQPSGDLPRIKLDLTDDEVLVLNPVNREVSHPYSDRPEQGIHIQCYSFEELFAEKMRALYDRLRPRDLYDVIHLYRHEDITPDRALVLSTLQKKCDFKKIPIPTFELLNAKPEHADTPRYAIELTTSGPISAPPTQTRTSSQGISSPYSSTRSRKTKFGPTYVIECSYCRKRFNRSAYTTQLNPHKDKSGYLCSGRIGYIVETKH